MGRQKTRQIFLQTYLSPPSSETISPSQGSSSERLITTLSSSFLLLSAAPPLELLLVLSRRGLGDPRPSNRDFFVLFGLGEGEASSAVATGAGHIEGGGQMAGTPETIT